MKIEMGDQRNLMRMRRKPNLDARLQRCSHMLIAEPETLRGCWLREFQYNELHIELGCGKGRFTIETAKSSPGAFVVALEKSANVMISALERADAEGIRNVRFISALADNITEYFAPGESDRIYINFCDPWPTGRHAKRRLTHRRFLELYSNILRPGGEIHFKTDNLPLFEFSLHEFEHGGFGMLDISRNLHKDGPAGTMTDYEIIFHDQGMPIYSARIRFQPT